MSDDSTKQTPQAGGNEARPNNAGANSGPRMLPAVILVVAHLSFTFGVSIFAATTVADVVGLGAAPLLATLLLLIWWLFSTRVAMRERFAGVAVFFAAVFIILATHGPTGIYLLVLGLPALTTSTVAILFITKRLPWHQRRRAALLVIAACVVIFVSLRQDGVSGSLVPQVSWRWTPTPEEIVTASSDFPEAQVGGFATLPAQAGAKDWPAFRGPLRDGSAPGVTFATDWDTNPPRELWRRPVGLGWSSFSVVGDYIFTQEQRGSDELVVCYSADSGEEVWSNRVATRWKDPMGSGPRATPTFEDGKLYTLGATGTLQCLEASTGETIWKRELAADSGAKVPQWGFASSPVISGELVIVFSGADSGSSVVAYHRESGEIAWSSGDGSHGYSSVQLSTMDNVLQLLAISNFGLQSLDPQTGEMLWEHSWDMGSNARVVQPCVVDGHSVLIGSSFGLGTRLLDVKKEDTAWSVEEKWTTKSFRPYFNDFVYHDGHCYGFDGNRFSCVNAETGERIWKGGRYGGQVLLLPDMQALLVLSEKGDLVLLEASPDGQKELGKVKALSHKTWNHPVIAQGRLFVRNDQEAVCFELPQ